MLTSFFFGCLARAVSDGIAAGAEQRCRASESAILPYRDMEGTNNCPVFNFA